MRRCLADKDIRSAIEAGFINVCDTEKYIAEKAEALIQPASQDLVLQGLDGAEPLYLDHADIQERYHPDFKDGFVTFWPGHDTTVYVDDLIYYDGDRFFPALELRSTCRRLGLERSANMLGPGFDRDVCFLDVRNPQKYPVTIEIGTKIAQVIWIEKRQRHGWVDAYLGRGPVDPLGSACCRV
jgi:hypothetical protein